MESKLKEELRKVFPLKVSSHGIYVGMGECSTRFKLETNDEERICFSDFEPKGIERINLLISQLIEEIE